MSKKIIKFPSELVDSIEVQKITLGADPEKDGDAANKKYVDNHALKTITITAGAGLTGGGDLSANRTLGVGAGNGITVSDEAVAAKAGNGITVDSTGINHAVPATVATNVTASGRTYITGITLDTYGHVTGLTTGSETVTDTTYTLGVNDTQGQVTFKASTDSEATPYNLANLGTSGAPTFATVTATGQIEAQQFNAKSDARLKENFEPLVLEKSILDLPTYKFDFINGAKSQIGCKAQDLREICPEIVVENDKGYLSIQESKIVYLLLEEVKKLKAEIEVLINKD